MSKDIQKLIRRIYNTITISLILIVGVRFILGCYHIFTEGKAAGGQIYSRAAVAGKFAPMAWCTYLCLVFVIGSFFMHWFMPAEKKKVIPEKNRQLILARLRDKTNMAQLPSEMLRNIKRQAAYRKVHLIIGVSLLGLFSTAFLVYACRPSIWPVMMAEVSGVVVECVNVFLFCLLVPAVYIYFATHFCKISLDKEIELMKEAAKLAPSQNKPAAPAPKKELGILIARYSMMAIAIVFIIYGFANDGVADVIGKAAKICTECVGLG